MTSSTEKKTNCSLVKVKVTEAHYITQGNQNKEQEVDKMAAASCREASGDWIMS